MTKRGRTNDKVPFIIILVMLFFFFRVVVVVQWVKVPPEGVKNTRKGGFELGFQN